MVASRLEKILDSIACVEDIFHWLCTFETNALHAARYELSLS